MKHVGPEIKRLRSSRGWTLDDLAAESGVHRDTLGKIELGKQRPHHATLQSIARAFGPWLISRTTDPRLLEVVGESAGSTSGGAVGIEDRLGELLVYVKTLKGKSRSEFIRAVVALLTALEHAGAGTGTDTPSDNGS